jgi:hypothetical protein
MSPTTSLRAANCPCRWPSPTGWPSCQRTVASAPFPTVAVLDRLRVVQQAEPQRPVGGHLERRRHDEKRLVVEIVEVIGDDIVEREPGGAGRRLDNCRRPVRIGQI